MVSFFSKALACFKKKFIHFMTRLSEGESHTLFFARRLASTPSPAMPSWPRFQGLYKRGDQMPVAPNFRSVKANLVYTHEGRKLVRRAPKGWAGFRVTCRRHSELVLRK